jgi:hypothetical protein
VVDEPAGRLFWCRFGDGRIAVDFGGGGAYKPGSLGWGEMFFDIVGKSGRDARTAAPMLVLMSVHLEGI